MKISTSKQTRATNYGKFKTRVMIVRCCWYKTLRVFVIWATSWQNQQWMCAERRLRSARASAQSDQSLRCPHEESLGPKLPTERRAKTLIRLGGRQGWSESSLGAQSLCWFCHEAAHLAPPSNRVTKQIYIHYFRFCSLFLQPEIEKKKYYSWNIKLLIISEGLDWSIK